MTRLQSRLLLGALLMALVCSVEATDDSHNTGKKLKVVSSLQSSDVSSNTLLAPYPVGMELVLICQTLGNQTYWHEKTMNSGQQKLETNDSMTWFGLGRSVCSIPSLSSSDDGRQLMCIMVGSTMKKEVTLHVVDKPHIIVERSGPNLRCWGSSLHSRLQLCWFKYGSESPVKCSTGNILEVDLSELPMHQSRHYVCKAQLRSEDEGVLEQEVLNIFSQIFEETNKTLKVNMYDVLITKLSTTGTTSSLNDDLTTASTTITTTTGHTFPGRETSPDIAFNTDTIIIVAVVAFCMILFAGVALKFHIKMKILSCDHESGERTNCTQKIPPESYNFPRGVEEVEERDKPSSVTPMLANIKSSQADDFSEERGSRESLAESLAGHSYYYPVNNPHATCEHHSYNYPLVTNKVKKLMKKSVVIIRK